MFPTQAREEQRKRSTCLRSHLCCQERRTRTECGNGKHPPCSPPCRQCRECRVKARAMGRGRVSRGSQGLVLCVRGEHQGCEPVPSVPAARSRRWSPPVCSFRCKTCPCGWNRVGERNMSEVREKQVRKGQTHTHAHARTHKHTHTHISRTILCKQIQESRVVGTGQLPAARSLLGASAEKKSRHEFLCDDVLTCDDWEKIHTNICDHSGTNRKPDVRHVRVIWKYLPYLKHSYRNT